MPPRLTTQEFIKLAHVVHENHYDYSLVNYKHSQQKVLILCSIHGVFEQQPARHLVGNGCRSCKNESQKLTTKQFIEKAKVVHGIRYGYSLSIYQSSHQTLLIRCPEHGMFNQTPNRHLSGRGCPMCTENKGTTESFIEKSRLVHGDKYDYSKVEYKTGKDKVTIFCKEHGLFEQTAFDHTVGKGCAGCAKTGFDKTKNGYLYILRSECGLYMKIGITNKPKQRYSQLSKATPFLFNLIETLEGNGFEIAELEKTLLSKYQTVDFTKPFNGHTEWRFWSESIRSYFNHES